MRTSVRMTTYSYILRTYDAGQPWVLLSTSRESVELDDGADFPAWAHETYPSKAHQVELEREPFRWATRE